MAFVSCSGLNDFIHNLESLGESTEDIVHDMLEAGGEVAVSEWKEGIERHGHVDTGAMRDAVKNTVSDKNSSAEIYPKGKDKKGVRNAEKAFIIHYGKNGDGDRFVDDIEEKAKPKIHEAMEEIMNEYTERNGS